MPKRADYERQKRGQAAWITIVGLGLYALGIFSAATSAFGYEVFGLAYLAFPGLVMCYFGIRNFLEYNERVRYFESPEWEEYKRRKALEMD